MLGVLDETPGLVAACRAHDRDTLDERTLHALLPLVQPGLRLLSGIGVPARWAELQRSSLDGLWQMLTGSGDLVIVDRSEEHTSELQSRGHVVCRLLLEKKYNTEMDSIA